MICQEIAGNGSGFEQKKYQQLVEQKKNVLYETDAFVVLPSIGPLNPSHILVVPKSHVKALGALPDSLTTEVKTIKEKLRNYCHKKSGKQLIFFEHGTGKLIDSSGGCVDHAHLHAIWNIPGVTELFIKQLGLVTLPSALTVNQVCNLELGYIYVEGADGQNFIKNNPGLPSQIFRRLYASLDVSVEVWNWRSFFNLKGIEAVIEYYSDLRNS